MSCSGDTRVSRTIARRRSLRLSLRGLSEGKGMDGGGERAAYSSSSPKKNWSEQRLLQKSRPKFRTAQSSHASLKQIGHLLSRRNSSTWSSLRHVMHSIEDIEYSTGGRRPAEAGFSVVDCRGSGCL